MSHTMPAIDISVMFSFSRSICGKFNLFKECCGMSHWVKFVGWLKYLLSRYQAVSCEAMPCNHNEQEGESFALNVRTKVDTKTRENPFQFSSLLVFLLLRRSRSTKVILTSSIMLLEMKWILISKSFSTWYHGAQVWELRKREVRKKVSISIVEH